MDPTINLPGEGSWKRFIIKYRDRSQPGRDPRLVQARLEQAATVVARDAASGLRLSWKNRLGIGADVFQADRLLDRAEAKRLMEILAADPDLEYVEVDALMQAYPQSAGPHRQR